MLTRSENRPSPYLERKRARGADNESSTAESINKQALHRRGQKVKYRGVEMAITIVLEM